MKSKGDKLDVNKLVHVPFDLKLSDAVKKDVYNVAIKNIEYKIPDITNVATSTTLNAKRNEVKGKIPSITNVASTAALNSKIDDVKNKFLILLTELLLLLLLLLLKRKFLMLLI